MIWRRSLRVAAASPPSVKRLRLLWEAQRWSFRKSSFLGLQLALVHYFMKWGEAGDAGLQCIFTQASHLTRDQGDQGRCAGGLRGLAASPTQLRLCPCSVNGYEGSSANYLADEEGQRVLSYGP